MGGFERQAFTRLRAADVEELTSFLSTADLTLSGLDDPAVRLWLLRDEGGALIGSTGYERSANGDDVIIRSVAVGVDSRGAKLGSHLAGHAIDEARAEGASRAWLFSRRSGPFWQKLGFEPADRDELAAALSTTRQVRLFVETGQLQREVAWSLTL